MITSIRVADRLAPCPWDTEAVLGGNDTATAGAVGRRLDVERLPDHIDRLYRMAYALCGSRQDAEDLVQETYERVLRRPRFVRRETDIAYLVRVLRNTHLALARERANRPVTLLPSEDLEWVESRGADQMAALESRAVFAAIRELPDPLREVVVAVDVAGLAYKEAARALGIREGTVMSRLYRARARLARALDGGVNE
jgi:RNA polymerase sigma-70 factor (ECF subfamily)